MDTEHEGDRDKPKYVDDEIDLRRHGVVKKLVEQDPTITAVIADLSYDERMEWGRMEWGNEFMDGEAAGRSFDWEAAGKAVGASRFLKYLSVKNSSRQYSFAFLAGLANNRTIERLELKLREIGGGGDDDGMFEILMPFFKNNHNLVQLKIRGVFWHWITESAITALSACPSLKSISMDTLNSSEISKLERTYKLLQILTARHTLSDISVEGGCIGPKSVIHLKNILDDPKCQLKSLTLGKADDQGHANALANNASVRCLKYTGPNPHIFFGSDSCNYTLEELDLSSVYDPDWFIDMNLVDALKRLPNLKILNLKSCKFETDQVWDAIFKAVLSPVSKLNKLILSRVQPPQGSDLAVLSQCILSNTSLKNLDLAWNSDWITVSEWKSFIGQLSETGCLLEDLTLTGNSNISESSPELARLMKVCSNMKRLGLVDCSISLLDWNRLVDAMHESSIECLEGLTSYDTEHWHTRHCDEILPRLLEYRNLKSLCLGALTLEATQLVFNRTESPQCRIESIDFTCRFENKQQVQQVARGWVTSLRSNSTVKSLDLLLEVVRNLSFDALWREFAQLMGEQDAIDETHSSNHTLEYIRVSVDEDEDEEDDDDFHECYDLPLPVNVYSLLQLNRDKNKVAVARRKVIRFHLNCVDGAIKLLGMNMGLVKLPQLLHWIGKEGSELSFMYGFICGEPGLFDKDTIEADRKKKARFA